MHKEAPLHLIARYLSREATPAEQEELLEWVARDAEHQKIFHHYSQLWDSRHKLRDAFDVNSALDKLNQRVDSAKSKSKARSLTTWLSLAAAVAIFLVAGSWLLSNNGVSSPSPEVKYVLVSTTRGERKAIRLPDSSLVKLTPNSSLRYPENFDGTKREVQLTGKAFFDIRRDEEHPFIISTGNVSTEVLGTSFSITADSVGVDVAVATGKVKVSDHTMTAILLPTEKVSYQFAARSMTKSGFDPEQEFAWTTNTILFDNTNLNTASRALEEWFGVSVKFEHPKLSQCVITGRYENESLTHILDAITFTTGIKYEIKGQQVFLSGKGCANQ